MDDSENDLQEENRSVITEETNDSQEENRNVIVETVNTESEYSPDEISIGKLFRLCQDILTSHFF